ncbi:MAG: hypothetical protein AAB385_02335, partial [Planctomycetota bacterium]
MKRYTAPYRLDSDERRMVKRRSAEFGIVEGSNRCTVLHDDGYIARIVRALGLMAAAGRRLA